MCMCVCGVSDLLRFRSGWGEFRRFGVFTARPRNVSLFVTDETSALSNMIFSLFRGQSACVHCIWIGVICTCSERILSKFQSLLLSYVPSMSCFNHFSSSEVKIELRCPIISSLNRGRDLFEFSDFLRKSWVYSCGEPFNKRKILFQTTL